MKTWTVAWGLVALLTSGASGSAELQSQTIQVEGHGVRVVTSELVGTRNGLPTVVFENGLGESLESWADVLQGVEEFAPMVAYDRAGTGGSEPDGVEPTPEHVAKRLHALLAEIGVKPPYILVGHSWGGALIRYFAGAYPDEVVGLVFVDPVDPTLSQSEELSIYEEVGSGQSGRKALYDALDGRFETAPNGIRAERHEFRKLMETPLDARAVPALPQVPLTILLSGRIDQPARPLPIPFDWTAFLEARLRHRLQTFATWARQSPRGRMLLLGDAGHQIEKEKPRVVVHAIRRVLATSRQARAQSASSPSLN